MCNRAGKDDLDRKRGASRHHLARCELRDELEAYGTMIEKELIASSIL
jgi:hypothetical protein